MPKEITQERRRLGTAARIIVVIALASIAASKSRSLFTGAPNETLAEDKSVVQQTTPAAVRLPIEGRMPSLAVATGWLNSPPLTAESLRGKVVLIDIWTYSCINWLRSLPYVRAWAEKYKDQGLVVIGVHAPEFAFERNLANVRRGAKALRVDCALRKTTSATSAPRTLRHRVAPSWTSVASTRPLRGWRSISGPFRVIGR